MTESLPAVSRTAVGVAALRAYESSRPDRLFDDPYAAAFAAAGHPALPATGRGDAQARLGMLFYPQVVIRTRFFDDYLLGSGCPQVVLLAAGLDARAFRLAWPPGTRVFEIDLPEVLAFKDEVLAAHGASPACERVVVPADLRGNWAKAVRDAGFDPAVPTAWLAEGLLIYLAREDAERLLTAVRELSAPGSRIAFEHRPGTPPESLIARARATEGGEPVTALWRGGLGGRAPEWLAAHGWEPSTVTRAELAARYGRPSDDDATAGGFVTAVL
ncbi:Leucine carboxyl methyltransferase [Amycolatopsis australiensis]|uniref:S-adenosyl-L-methionine-dependent methyltransferase n=1 Tax=Amycolatopsis australiensis TaxID=546364 RepID=A0A1K1SVA9_9PSEU|nr:SAM-dependent methyltransferase [Amycolatopsis australiensis]SFW87805.1 Leucine carboxyl methyltransferase [Amycolatopsis australiensis]